MKLNEEWGKKIELAGMRGNSGLERLAKYAPILNDADLLQSVERALDIKATLAPDPHPFPSPSDNELPSSGIPFGRVVRMDGRLGPPIYLPIEVLDRHPHISVSGGSGVGKSITLRYLTQQFTLNRVGSLILDTEGEYANLMHYLPEGLCWVFDDKTFKRNPLQPLPGEERRRTYGRVKRVFREMYLRDGSINLLGEVLIDITPFEEVI